MRTYALRFVSLSLTLSMIGSPLAVAAGVPKVEPVGVFMRGANLEWSSAHAESKASGEVHRQYHQNAEAERVLWIRENAMNVGSQTYKDANRDFVQKRNLMHRQWHVEKSGWVQPDHSTSMKFFDAELTIMIPESPTDIVDRAYDGVRISRRSLVNQVLKQQKLHSLTVGQ